MSDINLRIEAIAKLEKQLYDTGDVLHLIYDDKRYIVALFASPLAGLNGIRVTRDKGVLKGLLQIQEKLNDLQAMESIS